MRPGGVIWPILALFGVAYLARRLDAVEVRGESMAPTLRSGDRLLAWRGRVRAGDVVLAADPREPARELIKRVSLVAGSRIVLRGDNPAASTDGRAFGELPPTAVTWRAVLRYWPLDRFGRIPDPPLAALARFDEGGEPACSFPEALVAGERLADTHG